MLIWWAVNAVKIAAGLLSRVFVFLSRQAILTLPFMDSRQVTRALNSLVTDASDLLGGADNHALQQLIEDYFCGGIEQEDDELPDSTLQTTAMNSMNTALLF